MARTTQMRLLELMVLKQDISAVIEYIGKKGSFQFQKKEKGSKDSEKNDDSIDSHFYDKLKQICNSLDIDVSQTAQLNINDCNAPDEKDRDEAGDLIAAYEDLAERITEAREQDKRVNDAYNEANAFSNLQIAYSEIDNLSFIALRVGKIPPGKFEDLKDSVGDNAIVVSLGENQSHVLVATSKKGRFALDTELQNVGFVPVEIPKDFKGVPDSVLEGLKSKKNESAANLSNLEVERSNFTETHKDKIIRLLGNFAMGMQIAELETTLESTELVYRITGWIAFDECETYMKELDEITESRIAIRAYEPYEVPGVISGKEQVPVQLKHGKFVKSFERMIFSYGSPVYGSIDPTPFVAIFFTILFGFMFGDCGQGLVFLLMGILMSKNIIKVGAWNKFSPIFMAIGITSSIMGLLTGEFFGTEELLKPFALWVTGLFGNPRAPILHLMPGEDPHSIVVMFSVFGVAVGVGFVINTIGLIINIINSLLRKKYSEAFFGKNGLAGAVFFWYVISLILRIVIANHTAAFYDWLIIGVSLFFAAFAEPFERALDGKHPLFENGFGTYIISSVIEIIEVISGYMSNTISFVRVGAFALSHAVLNFTILTLTNLCGGQFTPAGLLVLILGNTLIIVLEGMIVAIQVIRLQYYEFFSKFFHETGKEFKPFKFEFN